MKTVQVSSIFSELFDSMFVMNKHGKMVFFPWGAKRQGYILKRKNTAIEAKSFYSSALFVYILAIIGSMSLDFWWSIGCFVICSVGVFLVYYFYTVNFIKPLSVAQSSYEEIVLEKIESDSASQGELNTQYLSHQQHSITQPDRTMFSHLKRFWNRFLPGQWALTSFIVGLMFMGLAVSDYLRLANELIIFFPFFFWGLGFWILTIYGEAPPGLAGFIQWKLPIIVCMIVSWLISIWMLYELFFTVVK